MRSFAIRSRRAAACIPLLFGCAWACACGSPGTPEATDASVAAPDGGGDAPVAPTVDASADDAAGDSATDAQREVEDAAVADATARDGALARDAGFDARPPEDATADALAGDDAAEDGATDSGFDAAPNVCGDGVFDPATEQCDDRAGNGPTGACSASCLIQDFLATTPPLDAGLAPFQYPPHTLGQGRHPLGAGPGGFGVAFVEQEASGDFLVRAETFDPGGVRGASFPLVGTPDPAIANADPVIAALSATTYAVAWGDTGAGANGPGIAMAVLDTGAGSVGSVVHANAPSAFPESAPDLLWAGGSLIAAWTDGSGASTDIKYATFDSSLTPTGTGGYLANTADDELDVALAPFGDSWAAAWWAFADGLGVVHVRAGDVEIVTTPVWAGVGGERPALVQTGPTTLFVAFSVMVATDDAGDETTTILEGAVVDTANPSGSVTPAPIALHAQADGGAARFPEASPAAVAANGQLWLAAWTGGQLGDVYGDETWLASSPLAQASDVGASVIPLPSAQAHRGGDQRNPALAVTAVGPHGGIAAAWEDYGATMGSAEARPDVVLQVVPLPTSR